MNTSGTPFIRASHGFNGHGCNSSKRRRLFWTPQRGVQMHSCNPKKNTGVYFGARSSLRGQWAAQSWSSRLCDKMKETNNISHRAAITGAVWSGNRRKERGFLLFPYILFETLLTDADAGFLLSFLAIKKKKKIHLKALFWCFIQTYFVFDPSDKFYILRGNCHNPNNDSRRKK